MRLMLSSILSGFRSANIKKKDLNGVLCHFECIKFNSLNCEKDAYYLIKISFK